MPNISETLKDAAEILRKSSIAEPRREAGSLLAFALGKDKTFLIAHSEYKLSAAENERFRAFLQRRAAREPFQYITGKQEFYGLDFAVTKDVLIPRPETEMIVENALRLLPENGRFCEIGIGSGCISISILNTVKKSSAIGADISDAALKVTAINAETHRVLDRLKLKVSDVFNDLSSEIFDLIVSNPPYISGAEIENLQAEVRDFEPITSLTDGADGLSIIKKIIDNAPEHLKPNGFLLLEIGINQVHEAAQMFSPNIWDKIKILPDLQNIPRMIKAQKSK